ncbi:hypothetical protein [Roseovarius pacificus]|uniref:hypothetical protein n=1 Tax=Roseovarius pacificus TaxID=337701 RepID=UPI0025922230|nr:hypothetical protein [Roseovarius pacificus]MDW3117746.1 hypothetical protein [Roseovarius pacificus]
MVTIANLWKQLFGKQPSENEPVVLRMGDLQLVPSSQTALRAERVLPGTKELEPVFLPSPPPVDPALVNSPDPDPKRDYGPSPIAEWSLTFEANERFDCAALAKVLHTKHEEFGRPTHYVRTPEGQVTYLSSADAPPFGVALIPAWPLGEWAQPEKERISAGAQAIETVLSELPEGFQSPDISLDELERQLQQVSKISFIEPRSAQIIVSHPEGKFWNGKEIWILLHQLGLKWGDMDCFQWADPTHQTDYLIWVEVDDDDLGYALPERIAAGTQNFRAVKFSFDILRSPSPIHVLSQLVAMTAAFQKVMSCRLTAYVDERAVSGEEELRLEVMKAVKTLHALGVKPGSDSVCRLI